MAKDHDLQDIIAINLERAIQQAVDIGVHILSSSRERLPESMVAVFRSLGELELLDEATTEQLVKAVGFRNTAVRAYRKIDWNIVFAISTKHLHVFRDFTRQVLDLIGVSSC